MAKAPVHDFKTLVAWAKEIQSALGGGLPERVYINALSYEMEQAKWNFDADCEFAIMYQNEKMGTVKSDFLINHHFLVWVHSSQPCTEESKRVYANKLKASGLAGGICLFFMWDGLIYNEIELK